MVVGDSIERGPVRYASQRRRIPLAADDPFAGSQACRTLLDEFLGLRQGQPLGNLALSLADPTENRMYVDIVQARQNGRSAQIDDFGLRSPIRLHRGAVSQCNDHAVANCQRLGPAGRRLHVTVHQDEVGGFRHRGVRRSALRTRKQGKTGERADQVHRLHQ